MKKYELAKIEILSMCQSDAIATSVTFETDKGIWDFGTSASDISEIDFTPQPLTYGPSYEDT